ncbi:exo-beta-N-acetylmuramidase NamZ domain-containing protein [uncultured Paludibaculum sp.]|uniref:exo-beta-N-acetylmuramidase NamZ domain-containing protein n=1 Tax=uncultured Paludibaculum sp. TaxID=1765020 RepID=UPI002AAB413A|nr:exo-beta-N-acetylmuramidase NamZ domain-containing protein [uncultured Paludibaculum sp.]
MKTQMLMPLMALTAAVALAQTPAMYSASPDIDRAIEDAIKEERIPGAVCLVGQPGKILHFKAYGNRALVPSKEAMTLDTIFDAASLTKVVATTSSIMKLFDEGRIRLNDKVTVYLPEFQGGKSDITVRQLMTHFSGLRPDLTLTPEWSGYDTGIQKALADKPVAEPGERMIYSDINYELLGEIVHKVSGVPLDEYARNEIFLPLGMKESMFNPPAEWRPRIAPTEMWKGAVLRGVVHDPTARFMGGVAGHAGLFTTAMDLARFATFMLNLGRIEGAQVVSPLTVRKFTEPQTPPLQTTMRGLGWDIDSPFSGNRGELFPIGSYGHTGFTGTSLWIDPYTKTYVILLANSVHPNLRPAITSLRGRVATIAAAAAGIDVQDVTLTGFNELLPARAVGRTAETLTGIDVLVQEKFARLAGKRVGLITNHTGLTRAGGRNIDAMLSGGVKLTALFSPEHGISGKEDQENVANARDEKTGLPVYSLYKGEDRTPGKSVLKGIDVLVFDIQDIGTRFYTYPSTMRNAMQAAAAAKIPILVLDRPDPITGLHVEGPLLEKDKLSFVGCSTLPLRHGMTMGELARFLNEEDGIHAQLEVVKLKNWRRADWFDATTLEWVDPSPNMRSLNAALLYPGIGMLEYSKNYSVGRGTDAPFEQVGADWINGPALAAYLNHRQVPGVRFYATRFTPTASNLKGKVVQGVRFVILDREGFSSLRLGLEVAVALQKLYPGKIDLPLNRNLIGSTEVIEAIGRAEDPRNLEPRLQEELQPFLEKRAKYLLYR